MNNGGGVMFGVFFVVFFILALIIRKISKRRDYDEREIAIRGKAYKTAYLVFLALVMVNGVVYMATGKGIADPYVTAIFSMCVSIIVFVFKCMAYGGYLSSSTNVRRYVALILAIGVMDICTVILDKNIVSFSGKDYFINVNPTLIVGVMLIAIAAGIMWYCKKENDGDEK